ncbi:ATP-grasp domain-containing protein [bacterium]|nr:MAG: ATP-grasp domain-containing protein [bacterium]
MGKIIGLTYDLKTDYRFKEGDPPDANAEFDHPATIDVIAQSIESLGHKVVRIGNVDNLLRKINNLKVDIVFNISEGISGRNRESQVPIILEMMHIPFVGSDGLTLGLSLDKAMTKKILISENIPTPRFFETDDPADNIAKLKNLKFPLIVKPRYEGSSKGLSEKSRVEDVEGLREQIGYIVKTYKQSALVEEFIAGAEYTVALIGNNHPEVLPPVQIKIDGKLKLGDKFYTFARIHSSRLEYVCPDKIDKALKEKLESLALKTYRAIDARDFGRVDFRVDADGNPYVLEINPLPSLSSEDVFMCIANHLKVSYPEMIRRILEAAFLRHGLN